MPYTRACPECGKVIAHSSERNLRRSIKRNRPCRSCSQSKRRHSAETKQKIAEAGMGHRHTGETKKKMREAALGRVHSPETRQKIRAALTGYKHTDEAKQKMRDAVRVPLSPEARQKIAEAHRGAKRSSESRRKMSLAKGGDGTLNHIKPQRPPEVQAAQRAAKRRDNRTCQECGATEGSMHAHHVKSYAHHPALRAELTNIITLCAECHVRRHKWLLKEERVICSTQTTR